MQEFMIGFWIKWVNNMKISEIICKLESLKDQHGDIQVMMKDYDENYIEVFGVNFEESQGQFHEEWEMPEGFKFIKLF